MTEFGAFDGFRSPQFAQVQMSMVLFSEFFDRPFETDEGCRIDVSYPEMILP